MMTRLQEKHQVDCQHREHEKVAVTDSGSIYFALAGTRARRLGLCMIVPPFFGSLLAFAPGIFAELSSGSGHWSKGLQEFIFFLPIAYVFMGLQALFSAVLMETVVRRFATAKAHIIIWSLIFGSLSGLTLSALIPKLVIAGAVVGVLLGFVLASTFKVDH